MSPYLEFYCCGSMKTVIIHMFQFSGDHPVKDVVFLNPSLYIPVGIVQITANLDAVKLLSDAYHYF